MLIPCSRAQVVVVDPGIRLDHDTPGSMVWDEHGGTFVLRVEGLAATEVPAGQPEAGISLEIPALPPGGAHSQPGRVRRRSSNSRCPRPSGPELLEEAVLAACHLPGQNLFVFAEEPRLVGQKTRGGRGDSAVAGHFKARRVPCRETDLVIHLTRAAMARLVAAVLSLARAGG